MLRSSFRLGEEIKLREVPYKLHQPT